MIEFFIRLFSRDFMPHGTCYLWDPAVLWLNVISDSVIAASYYAIPLLLFRFARARRDITFKWIFVAFGVFILACGTTHVMGALTAWVPVYRLDGVIKAITAIASVGTFMMLIPMLPALIALPSPSQLGAVNRNLEREIAERTAAEAEVRRLNTELEARVEARTAELAESEARFRQLAEAMPQIVWVCNEVGQTTYLNRRWVEYTGSENLSSEAVESFLHPDDRGMVVEKWTRSLLSTEPFEVEYRLLRRDGEYHWYLGRTCPGRSENGRVRQWFGTATDIDEQKRHSQSLSAALEQLRTEMTHRQQLEDQLLQVQKMEAVGRLAGGVAHDFNNLLTAILGYAELIRDQLGEERAAREFLGELVHAGERAAALTNQLLAFSRRQASQPRVLDLNLVVSTMEKMLGRIIGEDVVLETRLAPDLPAVRVDPTHIDQVLLNLAVNARDAMKDGGTLTVETSVVDISEEYAGRRIGIEPGRYVMLAVSDTGVGMDAATQARIFEPFFTTKAPGHGTGLGLSIVYGIVKQNCGEILVYSEPGHGATFKVYLPAVDAQAQQEPAYRDEPQDRGSETVLVVEDEEIVRNLARTMLSRLGYEVLDAASPREALEILGRSGGGVQLLLTDIMMPGMSGIELARKATDAQPDLKVLYMSGYTESGIIRQGLGESAAPDFLPKPFSAATLAAKVRQALDG